MGDLRDQAAVFVAHAAHLVPLRGRERARPAADAPAGARRLQALPGALGDALALELRDGR
jgi:hypothetical protein